jgi:phenylpropionate dioxygenase-like ring-hydroxylating dioxygenase large terminal subunit
MADLDHWHPLLPSQQLRKQPVGVRLLGRDIVLFRGEGGQVGALEDCCPHRRMRLSLGCIVGGRLQCPYHGWTFDCTGAGESPGTPKLRATAICYDAVDRQGAIWVRGGGSEQAFPQFDVAGYYNVATLQHRVRAPLEVVVDNFTEIEHTPTIHGVFGYPLERMQEVQVRFEPTETSVRVVNVGPSKRIPLLLRILLQVRNRYEFNDDWTTYFSPVYSVYDHWWTDPQTGQEAMVRWRLYIFFTPIDEQETGLMTFAFTKSRYPGPYGCVRPFRHLVTHLLNKEIGQDIQILEGLADKAPSIQGMKLSRFDRVLGLNRDRIERIYRGRDTPLLDTESSL